MEIRSTVFKSVWQGLKWFGNKIGIRGTTAGVADAVIEMKDDHGPRGPEGGGRDGGGDSGGGRDGGTDGGSGDTESTDAGVPAGTDEGGTSTPQ